MKWFIQIKEIFLTEGKNTSIDDIGEKEQQGNPDGWLGPEVSHDWEAPHQADWPMDDHAQAAEEHSSKPIPVAAYKLKPLRYCLDTRGKLERLTQCGPGKKTECRFMSNTFS